MRKMSLVKILLITSFFLNIFMCGADTVYAQQKSVFPVNISVSAGTEDKDAPPLSTTLKIVLLITVLSLAPSILTMMTSFTRIVIILSFMKRALAVGSQPSNQIMVGIALFLTFYIMTPVWTQINKTAVQPLLKNEITEQVALAEAMIPIREFMFKYTRTKDLGLFVHLSKSSRPKNRDDIPTTTLIPAFIISELKTAFQMGFVLFIPFLIIDMVTASVLLSMGMIVLPPMVISMPFKILMFVMVDGWYLIIRSITLGYQ